MRSGADRSGRPVSQTTRESEGALREAPRLRRAHRERVRAPGVVFGPDIGAVHGEREWVPVTSLARYRAVLRRFVGG